MAYRVLIVEDEVDSSLPLKFFLENNNCIVDVAEYADDAIRMFNDRIKSPAPYTAVITDIELRDEQLGKENEDKWGGIKVIEAILDWENKPQSKNRNLKERIVVLSGKLQKGDERWDTLAGKGFPEKRILLKPTSPYAILKLIQEIGKKYNG